VRIYFLQKHCDNQLFNAEFLQKLVTNEGTELIEDQNRDFISVMEKE